MLLPVRALRAASRRRISSVSSYLVNKAKENVASDFTASSVLIPSVDGEDWLLNRCRRVCSVEAGHVAALTKPTPPACSRMSK
jgi:hypothetical protein